MGSLLFAVPTELSGGRYPAPGWAILVLGGLVSVGTLVFLGVRYLFARSGKEKR